MTRMNIFIIGLGIIAVLGGLTYLQHHEIKSVRHQIRVVEAERDAARRTINVLAAERAAADRRNRAAVAGKEAIYSIPEGKDTPASETLLKALEAANNVGGIK